MRHKSGCSSFTYYAIDAAQREIQQYEHTGTVFGAINKGQFEALQILEPGSQVVAAFQHVVADSDQRIRRNVAESRALAGQRDALLPRLVSGELRV